MTLDVRQVVRALNMQDEEAMHNLLAAYARANGAFYISSSGVWLEPPTSGSASVNAVPVSEAKDGDR